MAEISRATLFGKLNELGYKAIESATLFCKMRGNPYVELVHWMHQLLQTPDSDLFASLRHFQVDSARLARDLTESLDRLPRGATSVSDLSIQVEDSVERGWVYGSLHVRCARGAHRAPGGRLAQDARPEELAVRDLEGVPEAQARRGLTASSSCSATRRKRAPARGRFERRRAAATRAA